MRAKTLRNAGLAGGMAVMLLSTTLVFAENNRGREIKKAEDRVKATRVVETKDATSTEKLKERREAKAVKDPKKEEERAKVAKKVVEIKDKARRELATKLAGQFENTNKVWTDHFNQLLDQYDALLVKAGSKANAPTVAIEAAKAKIAAARVAVQAQITKTYVPDISKVTTAATTTTKGQDKLMKDLRVSFKDMHKLLFQDLFALRDGLMKDAKRATRDVVRSFSKGFKTEGDASSTNSNK